MKVLIAHTRHTAQFRAPILSSTNFEEEEILPRLLHPDTRSAHITSRALEAGAHGGAFFGPTTIFFPAKAHRERLLSAGYFVCQVLRSTGATKKAMMLCNTDAVDGVIY